MLVIVCICEGVFIHVDVGGWHPRGYTGMETEEVCDWMCREGGHVGPLGDGIH